MRFVETSVGIDGKVACIPQAWPGLRMRWSSWSHRNRIGAAWKRMAMGRARLPANTASMSRDLTLLPIETSPRKPQAEKVSGPSFSSSPSNPCSPPRARLT